MQMTIERLRAEVDAAKKQATANKKFEIGARVEVLVDTGWQPFTVIGIAGSNIECRDRWSMGHWFSTKRRDIRRADRAKAA